MTSIIQKVDRERRRFDPCIVSGTGNPLLAKPIKLDLVKKLAAADPEKASSLGAVPVCMLQGLLNHLSFGFGKDAMKIQVICSSEGRR